MSLMLVKCLDTRSFKEQVQLFVGDNRTDQYALELVEPLTLEKFNGATPLFKKHQKFKHGQLRKEIGKFIVIRDLNILVTYLIILDNRGFNPEVDKLRQLLKSLLVKKVLRAELLQQLQ